MQTLKKAVVHRSTCDEVVLYEIAITDRPLIKETRFKCERFKGMEWCSENLPGVESVLAYIHDPDKQQEALNREYKRTQIYTDYVVIKDSEDEDENNTEQE